MVAGCITGATTNHWNYLGINIFYGCTHLILKIQYRRLDARWNRLQFRFNKHIFDLTQSVNCSTSNGRYISQ